MKCLKFFYNRTGIITIFTAVLLLHSCEKDEEYGNLLFSSDDNISYIGWSETTDEILYLNEYNYYDYNNSRALYAVDINTKNTRKIANVTNNYDYPIFQKGNKIYYFNDTFYGYLSLNSVDISGTSAELVKDSLSSLLYSRKYIPYVRYTYTDTSASWHTVLYDLESGLETVIDPGTNNSHFSISPDGEWLLLEVIEDIYFSRLSLYCTSTGEFTNLKLSSLSDINGFYWINDELYTLSWNYSDYKLKNMQTGDILFTSKDLEDHSYFSLSPSGQFLYYIEEERPALAASLVGSHYYLHLLNTVTRAKTVIDLDRDNVYQEGITFSPEENRIAYIRDYDQIYIVDL